MCRLSPWNERYFIDFFFLPHPSLFSLILFSYLSAVLGAGLPRFHITQAPRASLLPALSLSTKLTSALCLLFLCELEPQHCYIWEWQASETWQVASRPSFIAAVTVP